MTMILAPCNLFLCIYFLGQVASASSRVSTSTQSSSPRPSSYVNAVYFTNWSIYKRNYQPSDLPVSDISHIFYAFVNVDPDGTVRTGDSWADLEKHYEGDSWNEEGSNAYGCVKQLHILKKANRQLKIILSIGGWTWSTTFPSAASTPASRATFAKSAVAMMRDWGFDGIDVDWEYPANGAEGANLLLLLQAVRAELDAFAARDAPGQHFQLSIAAPAGADKYDHLPLGELGELLDHINLMSYDYVTSQSAYTGHMANLYANREEPRSTPFNSDEVIRAYTQRGVPPGKIVMGIPVYGRSFVGTTGLGQPFTGVGSGSWEAGVWDYKDLPRPGASIQYDPEAHAYFSYDDSGNSTKELVSFDTPDAVKQKVAHVQDQGLGGVFFWEASADRRDSESLIWTSHQALGALDSTTNCIDYKNSVYRNIAQGNAA